MALYKFYSVLLLCTVLLGVRQPPLLTDISCPPGAQQQTRRALLKRSIDGTDRQTDRGQFDRPCCACYASIVNKQNGGMAQW